MRAIKSNARNVRSNLLKHPNQYELSSFNLGSTSTKKKTWCHHHYRYHYRHYFSPLLTREPFLQYDFRVALWLRRSFIILLPMVLHIIVQLFKQSLRVWLCLNYTYDDMKCRITIAWFVIRVQIVKGVDSLKWRISETSSMASYDIIPMKNL